MICYSGFSVVVSPCKDDFTQTSTPLNKTMMVLDAASHIEGEGTVDCDFKDNCGVDQVIRIHAYYIPKNSVSPQSYVYPRGSWKL